MPLNATYLNIVADAALNGGSFSVTTVNVSLHTADPGATGTNEATGGSPAYARVDASALFGAASGGVVSNDTAITFNGTGQTVTHFGLWDSTTFMGGAALTASKATNSGDEAEFAIGAMTWTQT